MLFYMPSPLYAGWLLPISYARQRPLSWIGARERTWRLGMGTADGAMGGSYGAREFGAREWGGAHSRRSGGSDWAAFENIEMVLGFIVFWPIGLAILGYKFWQRRYGGPDLQTAAAHKSHGAPPI